MKHPITKRGFRSLLNLFPLILFLSCCTVSPDSAIPPVINSPPSVDTLKNSNDNNRENINDTELNRNRRLWKERNIGNYHFVCTQYVGGQYGFVPVLVKVNSGRAISTKTARNRKQLERIEGYDRFDTVEKMFDEIKTAIDRDFDLTVKYNQEFGFPEEIYMNPKKAGPDLWLRITVTEFEIIN
ncbi:MAG: hypothetical protein JSS81_15620 [Acidobacteria bacterium]|nr:hypothetical protein [Acidobacteriota bacterium]